MYSAAEVIKQARRARGWGQRRLAEVSGVPQPNVAAYETGHRVPSLKMVERLVATCGLQLRFDLEPTHSDVDARVADLLARPPFARLGDTGSTAGVTAKRLAAAGAPLVLGGRLAARVWGAPVLDDRSFAWCPLPELDRLRAAVRRCHLDLWPRRPRYAPDTEDIRLVYADGDEMETNFLSVVLGTAPSTSWRVATGGGTSLPVVGLDVLRADRSMRGTDRVAIERLAVLVEERGPACCGLDAAAGLDIAAGLETAAGLDMAAGLDTAAGVDATG